MDATVVGIDEQKVKHYVYTPETCSETCYNDVTCNAWYYRNDQANTNAKMCFYGTLKIEDQKPSWEENTALGKREPECLGR